MTHLINYALLTAYALSIWLLWRRVTGDAVRDPLLRGLVATLACLHAAYLYPQLYPQGDAALNLSLGNLLSAVAWMGVALFLAASLVRPRLNLGIVVLPLGLVGFLVGWLLPGQDFILTDLAFDMVAHISIAIFAYGVLSLAFAQALLLWIQEKQLRKPNPGEFFPALPPLEEMESNLLRLTGLGFVLLSANLITGLLTPQPFGGALFGLTHHTLLALLAWAGFGGLLLGRWRFGWRGRVAARYTFIAFGVLVLAYFGARFVRSVVLI